jgi:hypothetical protein
MTAFGHVACYASAGYLREEREMEVQEAGLVRWLEVIRAEYREVPGLHLTKPQFQRLWGLDPVMCDALLEALEGVNFLRRTPRNGYVRADLG